jgi:hypothetical protein
MVSIDTSGHALPDGIDPFVKNVGNWTDRINLLAEDFFLLMINNLIDVFAIHGLSVSIEAIFWRWCPPTI